MKTIRVISAGAAALLCLSLSSQAADDESSGSHKLSDFSIGEIVSGDQVSLDALEGKVVAIEMWGIN